MYHDGKKDERKLHKELFIYVFIEALQIFEA